MKLSMNTHPIMMESIFFNSILEKYGLKWVKNCPSKIARALND